MRYDDLIYPDDDGLDSERIIRRAAVVYLDELRVCAATDGPDSPVRHNHNILASALESVIPGALYGQLNQNGTLVFGQAR
jgi:hypothetical protein